MVRLGSIFNLWVLNLKWHMKTTFRQSKFLPDKLSEHRTKCLRIAPGRAETTALIPDHTALSHGIQVDQFSLPQHTKRGYQLVTGMQTNRGLSTFIRNGFQSHHSVCWIHTRKKDFSIFIRNRLQRHCPICLSCLQFAKKWSTTYIPVLRGFTLCLFGWGRAGASFASQAARLAKLVWCRLPCVWAK
jgi:hypothetical protein